MNITTKRKSNIELLRILCMMCLVAHHFTIHGNLYLNENIFVQRFSLIFAPLGKMCYVVFMVISSYFLTNANVKSKRFWKVWMEVLFYNIVMMLATLVGSGWNGLLSIKMIVGSILPMLGASHGYAVAYLLFLAFLPFIKILQEKMNEHFLGNLIFLLFSLEIVSWIIGSFIDYNAGIKSELFFFVLIYYSTLYLKKYDDKLLHVSRKTLFSWGGMHLYRKRPITRHLSNQSLLQYTVIKNKLEDFFMSQPIVPLTVPKSRRSEKKSRNEILMKICHEKVELTFFHSINQEVLETILDKVLFYDNPAQ